MQSTACDLSLIFKQIQYILIGLIATHVDGIFSTGTSVFDKDTRITARRFDAKPGEYDNLTFAGVSINTNTDGSCLIHQKEYTQKNQHFKKGCTYVECSSRLDELAWSTHNRPDVEAEVEIIAQVTEQDFKPLHMFQLNRAIKRMKDEQASRLIVERLNMASMHIIVHADASFANLHDFKTQLGFCYSTI